MWIRSLLLRVVLAQIAFLLLGSGRKGVLLPARALSLSLSTTPTTTTINFSRRGPPNSSNGNNNNNNNNLLEIHRTIQELQQTITTTKTKEPWFPSSSSSSSLPIEYESTTKDVIRILQQWVEEHSDNPQWKSLLNKANLRHEVEESIVALHHLLEWRRRRRRRRKRKFNNNSNSNNNLSHNDDDDDDEGSYERAKGERAKSTTSTTMTNFIALDACCGKGLFGTLLSYLAPPGLTRIILLDNNRNVDWKYIDSANQNHKQHGRPYIDCWSGINLHDHDLVVDKLLQHSSSFDDNDNDVHDTTTTKTPIAITGIHLCKTLSPTLIGIVNSLGSIKVPYLCLVPCCLPRKHQQLQIALYETPLQRQGRLEALKLRQQTKQRGRCSCYVCHGQHHVRDCPERDQYSSPEEWNRIVEQALLSKEAYCWNCGKVGHRKADCKEPRVQLQKQPSTVLEMTSCIYPTPQDPSLFAYCTALGNTLQQHDNVTVIDSKLMSSHQQQQQQGGGVTSGNWNRERKSLFIVATTTTTT